MLLLRIIISSLFIALSNISWAQCNITVNVGPDEAICAPGRDVQLNGVIEGSYLNFSWTPETGMSDPTILNPIATVTGTITYTLSGWANDPAAPELIQNGDFQGGNIDFSSAYTYADPTNSQSLIPEATYTVVNSPAAVHPAFADCGDHTTGTGQMMVVNGAGTINVNIWCETITVIPNTYYDLGAWISSVTSQSPAELQFSINGLLVGQVFNASSTNCIWEEFDAIWLSDTNTSVNFCITNQNTASGGNDFAIDDLSFKALCKVEDEMTITVTPSEQVYISAAICRGDVYELGDQFFDTPGSYFDIEVIDDEGCLQLFDLDLELIEINIISFMEPQLTCQADTVEISVDASTSLGALFYDWAALSGNIISDPSLSFILVDQPGTYRVIITAEFDGMVCDETLFLNVTESVSNPIAQAGPDGILDCNNATFELNGSGSSAGLNYNYIWSDTSGSNISNNLMHTVNTAGNYILTVVDQATGCTNTDTTSVLLINSPPSVTAGPDGVLDCNNATFELNGSGSSAGLNYNYIWSDTSGSNISNNLMHTVNTAGNYILTVVDQATGCTNTDTTSVLLINSPPSVTAGPDGILDCNNSSYTLNSMGSSIGNEYTYTWRNSSGDILSHNINESINLADAYSLTIVNNSTGCMASDTVRVTASIDIPDINAGLDIILDCGVSEYLIVPTINADPNIVTTWSTINGNILNLNTNNITVNQSGDYFVMAIDTTTFCAGSDTIHITFTEDLPPVFIDIPDTITCSQSSIDIFGHFSGDPTTVDFSWSTIGGSFNPVNDSTITITSSGQYTLTINDPIFNCTNTASTVVLENITAPLAHAGTDDVINCSDTVSLNGTLSSLGNNFSFLWTTSDGHIISGDLTPNPSINQAGIYVITVTDISNGCSSSDEVVITSNQTLPEAFIDTPEIINCNQSNITLFGSSTTNTDPLSYSWSTSDGNIISDPTMDSILVDQGGTYSLRIHNLSTDCSNSISAIVQADLTYPSIDAGPDTTLTCALPSVQLMGSLIENRPVQISWTYNSGNIISGAQTLRPLADRPGTYYLTAVFDNGCSSTDSVIVLLDQDLPQAVIVEPTLLNCTTQDQVLDASASSQGNQFVASWSLSDGVFTDTSSILMPTINSDGTFILEIINTLNNCASYDTVEVLLDTLSPSIDIMFNNINCIDTAAIIDASASSGQNDIVYLWVGNNIGTDQSGSTIISTTEAGEFILQITDQVNGCTAQTVTTVTEDYNVDAYNIILPSLYQTGLGQEVQLNARINFDSDLITSINWSDTSTLKNYDSLNPIACPNLDTDYQLLISIGDHCQISAETRVVVIESEIYIPNIFTPDNDGTNDGFTVYGGEDILQIDQMLIVNRWGDIVYNQTNIPSNNPTLGWDGTFNGELQPNGVYIYYVQVQYANNKVETFSGDVTSLR